MRYYPIKKDFFQVFMNNEIVLSQLIERKSKQLEGICEYINIYDFFRRCVKFYGQENYRLQKNTIIYSNPITKEENICIVGAHYFELKKTTGFEKWLERYFLYYYCLEGKRNEWYSYCLHKTIDE